MKKIQFTRDVFASGAKAFSAGQQADATPELQKHIRRGDAIEVEVPDPKPEKKGGEKAEDKGGDQAGGEQADAGDKGADKKGKK